VLPLLHNADGGEELQGKNSRNSKWYALYASKCTTIMILFTKLYALKNLAAWQRRVYEKH
jgi:hypothetical protein